METNQKPVDVNANVCHFKRVTSGPWSRPLVLAFAASASLAGAQWRTSRQAGVCAGEAGWRGGGSDKL